MNPASDEPAGAAPACPHCGAPVAPGAATCADHAGAPAPWSTWPGAGPPSAPSPWARPGSAPEQAPAGASAAQPAPAPWAAPPPPPAPPWPDPATAPGSSWGAQTSWPAPPKQRGGALKILAVVFVLLAVVVGLFATGVVKDDKKKAAAFLAAYESGTNDVPFTAGDAAFQATFPNHPRRTSKQVTAGGGAVTFTGYESDRGSAGFMIASFVLPTSMSYDLGRGLQGAATAAKLALLTSVPTTFNGNPAIEGLMRGSGHTYKAMIVGARGRIYLLMVGGDDSPPRGYEKFKSSFQITS